MGSTSDPLPARSPRRSGENLEDALRDAVTLCEKRRTPRFVGFLDETRRARARELLGRRLPAGISGVLFYGGHGEAERTLLGVFPEPMEPDTDAFPLSALAFHFRAGAGLTHRDFLGTLLSCGVERETVGDILCGDGLAVAFIDSAVAEYLAGQIEKVGGEGVRLEAEYAGPLPDARTAQEVGITVASPRLDAVTAAVAGVAREAAAALIRSGRVAVNHRECLSNSRPLAVGDVLSIRGTGRFRIAAFGGATRKGRLHMTVETYR